MVRSSYLLTVETRMPTNEEWMMIPGEAGRVVGKKYYSHIYHVYTVMIAKETNARTSWTEVQCRGPTYALPALWTNRSGQHESFAYLSTDSVLERWWHLRAQDPGRPERGKDGAG